MTIPLPEPVNFSDVWLPGKDEFNRQHAVWGYTADQLRAYGEAVRAEERERCAKLCEWLPIGTGLPWVARNIKADAEPDQPAALR